MPTRLIHQSTPTKATAMIAIFPHSILAAGFRRLGVAFSSLFRIFCKRASFAAGFNLNRVSLVSISPSI